MIQAPTSFRQVQPDSVFPQASPTRFLSLVQGFCTDVLGHDAKEIRLASMYVGPKNVGLFGPHEVSHRPMRRGANEQVLPPFIIPTPFSPSQQS